MLRKWYWWLLLAVPLMVVAVGCGGEAKEDSKTGDGDGKKGGAFQVSLPTAETPIDKSYITEDFVAAAVIHPARILNSKFGQDVKAALNEAMPGMADGAIKQFVEKTGIDPHKLDEVIVLLDVDGMKKLPITGGKKDAKVPPFPPEKKECLETVETQPGFPAKRDADGPEFGGPDVPDPTVILRFSEAVNQEDALKKVAASRKGTAVKVENLGTPYHNVGGISIAFVDGGKTALVAKEPVLKKMLAAKNVQSPLAKRLAKFGAEHDLIYVAAGPEVERQLSELANDPHATAEAKPYLQHLKKVKSIAVTFSVSSDPMVSVVIEMGDESSATELAKLLNEKAIPELKKAYEEGKSNKLPPDAVATADELVNGIAVGSKGNDFIVSLKRPSALENPKDLIKKLAPFLGGAP